MRRASSGNRSPTFSKFSPHASRRLAQHGHRERSLHLIGHWRCRLRPALTQPAPDRARQSAPRQAPSSLFAPRGRHRWDTRCRHREPVAHRLRRRGTNLQTCGRSRSSKRSRSSEPLSAWPFAEHSGSRTPGAQAHEDHRTRRGPAVDEDLRHRPPSLGTSDHLLAACRVLPEIDLDELDALACQEPLRPVAIWAHRSSVDLDRGHRAPAANRLRHHLRGATHGSYRHCFVPDHPRQSQHVHPRRHQRVAVRWCTRRRSLPWSDTSSTSRIRAPATWCGRRTRNARGLNVRHASAAPSPCWDLVARWRSRIPGAQGRSARRASRLASSADWLKPRRSSRQR